MNVRGNFFMLMTLPKILSWRAKPRVNAKFSVIVDYYVLHNAKITASWMG